MCTLLLPPGVNPPVVNKYIISYIIIIFVVKIYKYFHTLLRRVEYLKAKHSLCALKKQWS